MVWHVFGSVCQVFAGYFAGFEMFLVVCFTIAWQVFGRFLLSVWQAFAFLFAGIQVSLRMKGMLLSITNNRKPDSYVIWKNQVKNGSEGIQ